ncbi:hypothetical protein SHELI_v1c03850 [Spiroplasma helicoides]|uniref:Uncharacterized protein n=1 Tax=Spiroplasma helicoides TaxID=216938 RepID=A0A1B3SK90_9MOLU|nr:hypothetical protein [Spiroplasma helicoides]AOG60338.1 hypothetical protein SHELI_v1c03850 [Spiroplasma helicoides]
MNYLHIIIIILAIVTFILITIIIAILKQYKKVKITSEINQKKYTRIKANNNKKETFDFKSKIEQLKIENSKLVNQCENLKKELFYSDSVEIKNYLNNHETVNKPSSSFFAILEKRFEKSEEHKRILKFVVDKVEKGYNNKAKFMMTLEEFNSDNGWMIVISLLACAKLTHSSIKEKQSWFSNFSPLKSLFYGQSNNNFRKNTWLIFEKEIFWNDSNDEWPNRPDLMLVTKSENKYNIVVLELKQWSKIYYKNNFENLLPDTNEQIKNYKKLISERSSNSKLESLSYLYNLYSEDVEDVEKTLLNNSGKYDKKWKMNGDKKIYYTADKKIELSSRIYMSLTENKTIDELSYEELKRFLKEIEEKNI